MLAAHQSTMGTVTLGTVALHRITAAETCRRIADSLARGHGGFLVTANLDRPMEPLYGLQLSSFSLGYFCRLAPI